jgi:hypothetical protein
MFDYRYHALSLAAVLFALALGVLIGVAIGDSNLVSSAKSGIVSNLNSELGAARAQSGQVQQHLQTQEAATKGLYPLAVHDLLSGRSIGLVFLGQSSDQVNALVRSAVTQAGGEVASVLAVREPLELASIGHDASGTHYAQLEGSVALVQRFGETVGRELVGGGPLVGHDLLSRVSPGLLSAFDGQLTRQEGIVVMRAEPSGMTPAQSEAAAAFETGLLTGVAAAGVPAVGVELSSTEPSQITWYKGNNIASVDNLDETTGQVSLDYVLAGSRGAYGAKGTADSLLPTLTAGSPTP